MTRCRVYPGYTNSYTYFYGDRTILLERTRHARGNEVVHRQVLEFGTPAAAKQHFDTACGA